MTKLYQWTVQETTGFHDVLDTGYYFEDEDEVRRMYPGSHYRILRRLDDTMIEADE